MKSSASFSRIAFRLLAAVAGLVAWWLLYRNLAALARWLTYSLAGLIHGTALGAAVEVRRCCNR